MLNFQVHENLNFKFSRDRQTCTPQVIRGVSRRVPNSMVTWRETEHEQLVESV